MGNKNWMDCIIRQPNKGLKHVIRQDGAYFMVLLYMYQKKAGICLTAHEHNDLYDICLEKEFIDEHCYIKYNKSKDIFKEASTIGKVSVSCSWLTNVNSLTIDITEAGLEAPTDFVGLYERSMGMKKYYHVVCSDDTGKIIYDPIPNSKTVEFGKPKSYRLFKITKG